MVAINKPKASVMRVSVNVSDDVGKKIEHLPDDFEVYSTPALNDAVKMYKAVQNFLKENINLTELANVFRLDHIDMIVWLKENGINPPSIQGYSENGFTPEFERRIDVASEEAKKGIGLSPAFDNADDLLSYLHKEADKENSNED